MVRVRQRRLPEHFHTGLKCEVADVLKSSEPQLPPNTALQLTASRARSLAF
jgi:hypothetical protein